MSVYNIPVILKGPDNKKILVVLSEESIDTHYGSIETKKITKLPTKIMTSKGIEIMIYVPSYREFVLNMKRGAQIIYPKDVASIIADGDILPGSIVLEIGSGSGALTVALSSYIGPNGYIYSVDNNKKNQYRASKTLDRFLTSKNLNSTNYEFINIEATDVKLNNFDRKITHIITDIPEPWEILKNLNPTSTLKWVSYLPNITQVQLINDQLHKCNFTNIYIKEIIEREWKVKGNILRPSHTMNGHTGFLVFADLFI